jgi:predicted DNA-binding transcriptional regulator AlpA
MFPVSATVTSALESVFISTAQLSAWIGVSSITLNQWRARGQGPAFVRMGRTIRYDRRDVEAWLASQKIGGKSVTA